MWSQVALLSLALATGYYYYVRRRGAEACLAGALGASGGRSKRKKKNKKKAKSGASSLQNAEQNTDEHVKGHVEQQLEQQDAPESEASVSEEEAAITADTFEADTPDPDSADQWQAASSRSIARAQKPSALPVHRTAWSTLRDTSPERAAPASILRIAPAARPSAPPPPPRVTHAAPAPLTRKQRQNQRKSERLRDARAQAAAVQEQRLRNHQRELAERRSLEQWRSAGRLVRPAPRSEQPGGRQADIGGKLIWD
ncbi:hypothetical protein GGI05_007504 [Coemansia sp. RSA 2603]|nr:hypothetical protein GGI05_007504 [Coemansia sp. RSA 2603]